ncbi:hypothetical protein [Streptomyces sp. NPDC059378]|uniref:hypothetical protein n=1 Tax=Streptomyces sp. NPDC059378 TaxID=3346815 RepID=UPI0036BFB9F2
MARRLVAAVHVRHPETHELLILQPGDEPEEALAEAIPNPAAWEPDEESADGDGGPDTGAAQPKTTTETKAKPRPQTRKQADE